MTDPAASLAFTDLETPVGILVVGSGAVGKSSLVKRFTTLSNALGAYRKTVGVEFAERTVSTPYGDARLQLWDTAGQEDFDELARQYYQGAHAVALCCSVTDRGSLRALPSWRAKVLATCPDLAVAVVLNKVDFLAAAAEQDAAAKVRPDEVAALAREWKLPLFQVSVKSGQNVDAVFMHLATEAMRRAMAPAATLAPVIVKAKATPKRGARRAFASAPLGSTASPAATTATDDPSAPAPRRTNGTASPPADPAPASIAATAAVDIPAPSSRAFPTGSLGRRPSSARSPNGTGSPLPSPSPVPTSTSPDPTASPSRAFPTGSLGRRTPSARTSTPLSFTAPTEGGSELERKTAASPTGSTGSGRRPSSAAGRRASSAVVAAAGKVAGWLGGGGIAGR
ncbi:Ras- protein Rab-23 [Allomyces arbusculus]|nr:Ras- protein Rab-23 [Allomyces arbusculus]